MIKNKTKYLFVYAFALFSLHAFVNSAGNRPDIPPHVMQYIKAHEVDPTLRQELDKIFLNPEVYKSIAQCYACDYDINVLGMKNLKKKFGFYFYNDKECIFSCKQFPEFVFKIGQIRGFRHELRNIGRIRMAHILNDYALQNGLAVEAPSKKAYFLPHSMSIKSTIYYGPRVIIVADKKKLTPKRRVSQEDLSLLQNKLRDELEIFDTTSENLYFIKGNNNAILVDTEPISIEFKESMYVPMNIVPSLAFQQHGVENRVYIPTRIVPSWKLHKRSIFRQILSKL